MLVRLAIVGVSFSLVPITRAADCTWDDLPFGSGGPEITAFAAYEDSAGLAVYAAGNFTSIGGVAANHIAKWDGGSWSALGSGTNGPIATLHVFDSGSGASLCAGGDFSSAGGNSARNIACWDGTNWSAMGSGLRGHVLAFAVFDDGGGPVLIAGGDFPEGVARWSPPTWPALGGGIDGIVSALAVFDGGSGPELYAGGLFGGAGPVAANNIARWNGFAWARLGPGTNGAVLALEPGPVLYLGGNFTLAGGQGRSSVAAWDGATWSSLGSGVTGPVFALGLLDEGTDLALYVGGDFDMAGAAEADSIARWAASNWTGLDGGVNDTVFALLRAPGPLALLRSRLWVGGDFTLVGGLSRPGVAAWSCAGGGLCPTGSVSWIDPPSGVVDARRPHGPHNADETTGIREVRVQAPTGSTALECWALCESSVMGSGNRILDIAAAAAGRFVLTLSRPLTPGGATVISYAGATPANPGTFIAHPGNVNADQTVDVLDVFAVALHLRGDVPAPWGIYSTDIDLSGAVAAPDIIEVVDLLNGAAEYRAWAGTTLPVPPTTCP